MGNLIIKNTAYNYFEQWDVCKATKKNIELLYYTCFVVVCGHQGLGFMEYLNTKREYWANVTYLDPILGKIRFEGEHFASVDVGIVSFLKGLLQLVQLVTGEYCPTASGEFQ